jgi:phosphoribosylformylglycinamidine synthase subunit PurQ / glutaminase
MGNPKALILAGFGHNCEDETAVALRRAGASPKQVNINDLVEYPGMLRNYQILVIPGGFSYGDDTGSGYAMAARLGSKVGDEIKQFVDEDKLALGICNGFQIMANLGLFPVLGEYGDQEVALVHNEKPRYTCRWVDLKFDPKNKSPWTEDLNRLALPIAHGEGRFYAPEATMVALREKRMVAARYVSGEMCKYLDLPADPNGSLDNVAALTNAKGNVFGMMPHPERATDFIHLPSWQLTDTHYRRSDRSLPQEGPGMRIFTNAVNYFR